MTAAADEDAATYSQLATIWSQLLDVPTHALSLQSDFYELGGNSMLLLSLQIALAKGAGIEVDTSALLAHSSFAAQLQLIKCYPGTRPDDSPDPKPARR